MASTASSRPANPTSPSYSDDLEFVTAYLTVHALSDASHVYAYLLWIALGTLLLFWSTFHHLHLRGGYLGALWSKWALRRRTWRKKHSLAVAKAKGQPHRQPYSFPSNAQIFTVCLVAICTLVVSFVGPDNLAPGSYLWTLSKYPYATTSGFAKREYTMDQFMQFQPQYTIPKAWWTMGDRTGMIAFALFPLCVLFALKSPPFAILSMSLTVQVFCDKLMLLHKWTALLIYLLTVLHVAFWSVQLFIDHRNGKIAYFYAWQYEKFLFAWIAFGCMTLVFLLSIGPFRKRHYEAFWFLHILFVPLTIVMAALHHPPVWWWCWAALALWVGERTWRFTWWLYTNGFVGAKSAAPSSKLRKAQSRDKDPAPGQPPKVEGGYPYPPTLPSSAPGLDQYPPIVQLPGVGLSLPTDYVPPPGFAHAELLPGRTVRLRIVTPGYLTWAPGQHFLISVLAVTRFTTHPFTTASICDEQNQYDDGRVLVFIIRAKNGWTKDLWDTIAMMHARGQQCLREEHVPRCEMPERGVLLRACVDGPFGSSARASWGEYSSVVIVAGGSGVSYALSILQYICLCMAGRDGRFLGGRKGGYGQPGYKTSRVRFLWLVREFGHIQWCAPTLRRCLDMISPSELQIDIFVTNVKPVPQPNLATTPSRISFAPLPHKQELEPPRPEFARPKSISSLSSDESGEDSDVDLSYYTGFVQDEGELGHEEHVLDLTNFEGDNDAAMPGEAQFNLSIKNEGRSRRFLSRRASTALQAKEQLTQRASQLDFEGPSHSSVQLVRKPHPIPPIDTSLPPPVRVSVGSPGSRASSSSDLGTRRPESQSTDGRHDSYSSQTSLLKTPTSAAPLVGGSMQTQLPPIQTRNPPGAPGRKRFSHLSTLSERTDLLPTPTTSVTPRSTSRLSQWTDTDSFAALVPRGEVENVREQLRLNLDEQEAEDVGIVAEHARPGKPKLERILADEVERAKGAIAVACCGPTSLDAMIRKIVAAQIDPQKVKRGDMRGSIALFSEEFSY
ncbi:hypothetical protein BD311DRAFT_708390 [Dichomitus squalens]|uniref:ferric-chelate reductase (NADPH) n=1 Tax=Dichomitus squalens TaxID=114155 RepID=A0A4Q9N9B1_9APHY|nr:hypothetical protein BD311DRAFT_708390 [Dichomitus squalens]